MTEPPPATARASITSSDAGRSPRRAGGRPLQTIQGYRPVPALIPRLGDERSPVSYIGALLTVAVGLLALRLTRSGTRPVIA